MLFFNCLILGKNNGVLYKEGAKDSSKIQIIFLTDELLLIKCSGHTGYVDRSVYNTYTPAMYELYSVKEIKNYNHTIHIYVKDLIDEIPVKSINNLDIVQKINSRYAIEPYNLPNSEQEWSEVIQKNKSYIEELKSQSKNIQKATLDEH